MKSPTRLTVNLSIEGLTIGLLLLIVLFVLVNSFVPVEPLRSSISLIVMFIVPGYLILSLLKAQVREATQRGLFALGLSLLFLMVCGLLVNTFGVLLHIPHPLSAEPMLIALSMFLLALTLVNRSRNRGESYLIGFPRLKVWEIGMYLVPPLLTLLSVFGATLLSNNLGNEVVLVMLGGVGLVYLLLILFCKRLPNAFIFWSIYWLTLCLLFMTSLRSPFVTGHDIQREYFVLELNKTDYTWDMAKFQDAYNACLSITILPIMISDFVRLSDAYIFKVLFQVIFAATPLIMYLIARRMVSKRLALVCVIIFSSFPTFFYDMPFITRQEIGFYFFGLMILLILNWHRPGKLGAILFVAFGIGMVLSHYSTSYVAIALFMGVFIENKIIGLSFIKKLLDRFKLSQVIHNSRSFLKWQHLAILIVALTFWNILITKTSGSFMTVIRQTIDDILYGSSGPLSADVHYSIFSQKKLSDEQLVAEYYKTVLTSPERRQSPENYFPDQVVAQYTISSATKSVLPLTPLGQFLTSLKIDVFSANTVSRALIANGIQGLLFIGVLVVFLSKRRSFQVDLYTMTGTGIFFLVLIVLLPYVSVEYGLLRLFLQMLFVFSIFIVIALSELLSLLKGKKEIVIGVFSVVMMLHLVGFIPNLTGGFYPQLNTNNDSLYYDAYYIHRTDVAAAEWLRDRFQPDNVVQASVYGSTKLQTYSGLFALKDVIPPAIRRDSYVFLDYTTVKKGIIVNIEQNIFVVNVSTKFLNDYKDLIYNNGFSVIYK